MAFLANEGYVGVRGEERGTLPAVAGDRSPHRVKDFSS
jgi:hypothetical protein